MRLTSRLSQSNMSRLPRGRRGLKFEELRLLAEQRESPPAREAWIEMLHACAPRGLSAVASREGGVD